MQEITSPGWGWGGQRVLNREHIFCYNFGSLSFLCIRVQMKLRRVGLCSECLFIFVHFDDGIM